jgi:hypothetical protein
MAAPDEPTVVVGTEPPPSRPVSPEPARISDDDVPPSTGAPALKPFKLGPRSSPAEQRSRSKEARKLFSQVSAKYAELQSIVLYLQDARYLLSAHGELAQSIDRTVHVLGAVTKLMDVSDGLPHAALVSRLKGRLSHLEYEITKAEKVKEEADKVLPLLVPAAALDPKHEDRVLEVYAEAQAKAEAAVREAKEKGKNADLAAEESTKADLAAREAEEEAEKAQAMTETARNAAKEARTDEERKTAAAAVKEAEEKERAAKEKAKDAERVWREKHEAASNAEKALQDAAQAAEAANQELLKAAQAVADRADADAAE